MLLQQDCRACEPKKLWTRWEKMVSKYLNHSQPFVPSKAPGATATSMQPLAQSAGLEGTGGQGLVDGSHQHHHHHHHHHHGSYGAIRCSESYEAGRNRGIWVQNSIKVRPHVIRFYASTQFHALSHVFVSVCFRQLWIRNHKWKGWGWLESELAAENVPVELSILGSKSQVFKQLKCHALSWSFSRGDWSGHCDAGGCWDEYGGYWDEIHGGYYDEYGRYWEEGWGGYYDTDGTYYKSLGNSRGNSRANRENSGRTISLQQAWALDRERERELSGYLEAWKLCLKRQTVLDLRKEDALDAVDDTKSWKDGFNWSICDALMSTYSPFITFLFLNSDSESPSKYRCGDRNGLRSVDKFASLRPSSQHAELQVKHIGTSIGDLDKFTTAGW